MKSVKYILLALLFLLIMGGAYYAGLQTNFINKKTETNADVVLEKVKKVFKFTTVEGNISEIYDYKDYYNWDLPFFRKKAIIRVNAKVSAGFDFEKVVFTTEGSTRTIYIENFPKAEVLSLEHDLDYYDITQGTFNTFTTQDYNQINKDVKAYAEAKAIESEILDRAEEHKDDLIDMFKVLMETSGWKLVIKDSELMFRG